jgi:predicted nucleic acid-binding protein
MEKVKKVVIDTSAIIAILVNEPIKPILIARTIGADLFAPNSVHWEIGNAFSAMLKRKQITIIKIHQALDAYKHIPIHFIEVDVEKALVLSDQLNIYAYDAYIIRCALDQGCTLLTLDNGLLQAAKIAGVIPLEINQ